MDFNTKDTINHKDPMVVRNQPKAMVCKRVQFGFLELELMDPWQRKRVRR